MNKIMLAFVVIIAVLAVGCPHNNYEVTLIPRGDVIERTLVFFRFDDSNSPGTAPHYEKFNPEEMESIASFYPKNSLKHDRNKHSVKGEFTHELPGDVGGAGWYTNLSTSLGDASFYVERFRGSDDIVGMVEKKYEAADQLIDLVIGWCNAQLKSEPGFQNLYRFLDQDFRRDVKNFSLYDWMNKNFKSSFSGEEYGARFGQFLIERGYVNRQEAPGLIRGWGLDDGAALCRWAQQVIARKLGVAENQPIPQSLIFVADPKVVENSWKDYLADTAAYKGMLRSWEESKTSNPRAPKPDPIDAVEGLLYTLLEVEVSGELDDLTVRLSLPSEPLRTNGEWDETSKQVVWESKLVKRSQIARLPVLCFTDWVAPNENFQKDHFGSVSLTGEKLLNYCLWRTSLEEKKAFEWEQFLTDLKPGVDVIKKVDNFRFTVEPEQINEKEQKNDSDMGKELIKEALQSMQ